jgi:hypothetical protein
MATFGALRHPWNRLLPPYRTHVLCPLDLCPNPCRRSVEIEVAGKINVSISIVLLQRHHRGIVRQNCRPAERV